MSYPFIEAIRQSCPVVQQKLVDAAQAVKIIEEDKWEKDVGKAICSVDTESMIIAKVPYGCRGVTAVSSTGCPLRDAAPVKVRLK